MAVAVFSGSASSGGGGVLDVFTAQKRHPRVQVSPAPARRTPHHGATHFLRCAGDAALFPCAVLLRRQHHPGLQRRGR